MPLRAGAARRGRTESVTGVWLQRDDGGGDGELRSGLSPGGRVRLFVVTTRKKNPDKYVFCVIELSLDNTMTAADKALKIAPRRHRKWCLLLLSVICLCI